MARDLDGVDDHVDMTSPVPTASPRPVTISIWAKADDTSKINNSIFCNNTDRSDPRLYVEIHSTSGTTNQMRLFSGSFNDAGDTFTLDTDWHHYVWTWENDDSVAYFRDGVAVGSTSKTQAGSSVGSDASFGAIDNLIGSDFVFDGDLDSGAVLDDIITLAEIGALGRGANIFGFGRHDILQLDMPLNGNNSPEPDFSGNDRDGTLTGTTKATTNAPVELLENYL